jgi:hypothetical protein
MKHWLQSRSVREQLLVTLLVVVFAAIWLFSAFDRVSAQFRDWKRVRETLAMQTLWIDRQADIESQAAEAVKNLDPARTYDGTRLVAMINTLATQSGLPAGIDAPKTDRTPQFNFHTVRVTANRATLPALLKFYDELANQVPYLNLESVTLQEDRSSAGQVNATLQISATQIAPSANQ